jgi:hypothetical protein
MTTQASNATCRSGLPGRFNSIGAENVSHTAPATQRRYQEVIATFGPIDGDFSLWN